MNRIALINLLENRKKGIPDDRRLGLVIQGGGLRGVFAGGVMIALQELGYADVFDCIYGVSAGSCCGAYLLSHQTRQGTSIFYEDLSGWKFIKPWRPFKIMDLDLLCDKIMVDRKPLDVGKIKKSKTDLKIIVTEADTGEYTYLSKNDESLDVLSAIKASCSYPGLYYPLVTIANKKYLDGNAVKSFPIDIALKDGCTDLMVVTTVPSDYREKKRGRAFLLLTRFMTIPLKKNVKTEISRRINNYNKETHDVFYKRNEYRDDRFLIISPEYAVKNSERNKDVLERFAKHGEEVARKVLAP